MAGAYLAGASGSAYVLSGVDGSVIYRLDGENADDGFGYSVAGGGDLDGDGTDDILVGALDTDFTQTDAGSIYAFSGADGSQLYRRDGRGNEDELGYSIAGGGDVDNDGNPDVVAGAYHASPVSFREGSAFLFLTDFSAPTEIDNQLDDTTWYNSDPGTLYDVDYSDTGGALVESVQYSIWSSASLSGTELKTWTDIASGLASGTFVADWGELFSAATHGSDYVSVRAYDNASNTSSIAADVFFFSKDTATPSVTDNQADDSTWYNSDPGAVWDVDFSDAGGALLDNVQYAIWSSPTFVGAELKTWTDIASGIGTNDYTADWALDFSVATDGVNYVSARAYDAAGNVSDVATDVFFFRADTATPTVTDNQADDTTWHTSDPGAVWDVDFADAGGSLLNNVQYSIWTGTNRSGDELKAWTNIATGVVSASYTADWGVDFTAATDSLNYVSVRAYDVAGNVSAVASDVFFFKADTASPTVIDNQADDNTWVNSDPGAVWDVDFSDANGSALNNVQYTMWTASDQTGTELKSWTDIATSIGAASYPADWAIDFSAATNGLNLVSARAYDNAGNVSAVASDVFYFRIDVATPTITDNQADDTI